MSLHGLGQDQGDIRRGSLRLCYLLCVHSNSKTFCTDFQFLFKLISFSIPCHRERIEAVPLLLKIVSRLTTDFPAWITVAWGRLQYSGTGINLDFKILADTKSPAAHLCQEDGRARILPGAGRSHAYWRGSQAQGQIGGFAKVDRCAEPGELLGLVTTAALGESLSCRWQQYAWAFSVPVSFPILGVPCFRGIVPMMPQL